MISILVLKKGGGGAYPMQYIGHGPASPHTLEEKVPDGFSRIMLGDIVAYINWKPRHRQDW